MTLERSWCRCLAVGDETGHGGEGDVERLPPLGALPLTRHLFPIPLQATCSPSGPPPKYCFLSLGNVWKEPFFPMLCPHCQTPAAPGLCRAEQPQDTLVHSREHRPGVNAPFLIPDCWSRWGEGKKQTLCSVECRSKEIRCANPCW